MTSDRRPFEWLGGALCLDFVNTVSWGHDGLAEERLLSYDDLAGWCREAGLTIERNARIHREALKLRATLHAVFLAHAEGKTPLRRDQQDLAMFIARMQRQMTLVPGEGTWQWTFDHPLSAITWDAASLLTSVALNTVRRCRNDRCRWLFVDSSRRGNRRWCDMEVCGSRAKARRYYARKKASAGSPHH